MGVGNVGSFIAHGLRGIPNPPPVTLIFSNWDKLNEWNDSPKRLSLVTDGDTEARDGYDAELAIPRIRYHGKEVGLSTATEGSSAQSLDGESTGPISSLIVCTKAPFVLQGLSAVKHRLHKDSVVLFLQNGMGTVDEVNREIFPDPATRPHYMLGINSHGMHSASSAPFTTVHAGFGTISLGLLPHERDRDPSAPYLPTEKFAPTLHQQEQLQQQQQQYQQPTPDPGVPPPAPSTFAWTSNQRHLLRTLLRTPVFSAASFSPPDLLQLQLEKLAINSIINPLTVLLDARNGSILYNYSLTRCIRLLLSETSLVLRSLPELAYIPNVAQRFDPGRLETLVVSVAQKTQDNVSSMLADVRAGTQTEVDYINGWVVKKGEELGVRCAMNYFICNLVKGKKNLVQMELGDGVPIVGEETREKQRDGEVVVRSGIAQVKKEEKEKEKEEEEDMTKGKL